MASAARPSSNVVSASDPTPATTAPTRRRRPSDTVAADLLDAAVVEFAAQGFAGASTRRIAERAGAHQPQINYHFRSKEHLWQEAVDHLFARLAVDGSTAAAGASPAQALSATLRRFIDFSAAHPELNRIINLEATVPSDRLDWLVATHLRPLHDLLAVAWQQVRASGDGADLAPSDVWELVTSYGALHFANAPMLSLLDPGLTDGDDAGRHAERLLALLGLPVDPPAAEQIV